MRYILSAGRAWIAVLVSLVVCAGAAGAEGAPPASSRDEASDRPSALERCAAAHHEAGVRHYRLGQVAAVQKDLSAAIAAWDKAIRAQASADTPAGRAAQLGKAESYRVLGQAWDGTGESEKARQSYETAIAILRRLQSLDSGTDSYRLALARVFLDQDDVFEARSLCSGLESAEARTSKERRRVAGDIAHGVALYYTSSGDPEDWAWPSAFGIRERLAEDFPKVGEYQDNLAVTRCCRAAYLGRSWSLDQRVEGSWSLDQRVKECKAAIKAQQDLIGREPHVWVYRNHLMLSYCLLGMVRESAKQKQAAAVNYLDARKVGEKLVQRHPDLAEPAVMLASVCYRLGVLQWDQGQSEEAAKTLRRALDLRDRFPRFRMNEVDAFGDETSPKEVRDAIVAKLRSLGEVVDGK